ncbi:MAG: dihydroorotate dehydrogenase [Acidimicrobiaceae bacterium]|nr:dihydroorotate dehydrogenase [Acidimicrobiaceae bacterium]
MRIPNRKNGQFSVDLETNLASLKLDNPVMTAAGTSGHGAELSAFFDLSKLGAVVVKSVSAYPWPGNPGPRLAPLAGAMLNSVGLAGPGIGAWAKDYLPGLRQAGAKTIVSIWGKTVEEYAEASELLAGRLDGIVAVEVNVSCPNLKAKSEIFSHSARATRAVIEAVRPIGIPIFAKLSPNTHSVAEVAEAAVEAGACGVTMINTVLGMSIDPLTASLDLGGGGGGLSGPAIRPIALRAVYELKRRIPEIVIIGVGGISSGRDALAMMLAGASAIQVGTATFSDPKAPLRVLGELTELCARLGISRLSDVVGYAPKGMKITSAVETLSDMKAEDR